MSAIKIKRATTVVVDVTNVVRAGFVTEHCPETRVQKVSTYHEAKLSCGHYEYRYIGRIHKAPKRLACAACTGRQLSLRERMIAE